MGTTTEQIQIQIQTQIQIKYKYKYKYKYRYGHNHCRNPNKADRGPWCYVPGTKDSYYSGLQGWDYCAIPYCEGEPAGVNFPHLS